MKKAPQIIVTTHLNTDFDALASVIGATLLYPGSVGVIPKMVNQNVSRFLSTHKSAFELILPNEVTPELVEKLIVVDTDQWHRLDRMDKLKSRDDLHIEIWDHHMQNAGTIEAQTVHKEETGATVTLLIREMKRRKITLSTLESTVLLIGLYEDTGHLSFPSTTPEDAMAAAFLLEHGADLNVAVFFLSPPYEDTQREILLDMLKTNEKTTINGSEIGFNIVALNKKVTNLSSIVSTYRNIVNVAATFVIFVHEGHCTVIARSGSPSIDVGALMRKLGGGGHPGAASATIKQTGCQGVTIRDTIKDMLKNDPTKHVQIADLMSFPVITVDPSTPMSTVKDLMDEHNIRGIIVVEGDDIKGIIVLWDFKKIKKANQWQNPVKAFMTREVTTISPKTPPSIAANMMIEENIGYLPVVHDGKIIGIVTRTDVVTYFYGLIPE